MYLARISPLAAILALVTIPACSVDSASSEADDLGAADSDLTASEADCAATKNADGWCWATPNHPVGRSRSFLAFAENDAWTLASGVLVRWNGTTWKPQRSSVRVTDIWGTSSQDLWAVDEGAVYRRVNGDWQKVTDALAPSRLAKIWGSGPNDVWIVGNQSLVMHWDGATWSISRKGTGSSSAGFVDVHGTGPNDVWAVGTGPSGLPDNQVHHWDGATWTEVPHSVVDTIGLDVVRAFAPNDVWVGGANVVYHFDGATWSRRIPPGFRDGASGRGQSWTVTAIGGSADAVTIGTVETPNPATGRLFRFSNGAYAELALPEPGERFAPVVTGIGRLPSGKLLYARGPGDFFRLDGAASTRLTAGPQIDFVRASSRGQTVVASGYAGAIATRVAGAWTTKAAPGAGWLQGIAALPGAVVASGREEIAVLKAGAVTRAALAPLGVKGDLQVAGVSDKDLYVGSDQGVWHLLDGQWSQLPHPGGRMQQLALDASGAPIVATERNVVRYDGAFWTPVQDQPATAMTRTPDGGLWSVLGDGLFKDGQPVAVPPDVKDGLRYVTSMAACPDGRIYAVGSYGTLRAFEGGVWKVQTSDIWARRPAVACTSDGVAWLFGDGGAIVRKAKP